MLFRQPLYCIVFHETICQLTSEKIKLICIICTNRTKIFNQRFVLCIKFSAKFNFEIVIKAADYNYSCKLPEINTYMFSFSLTPLPYMDVHIKMYITEMIGILRQAKMYYY